MVKARVEARVKCKDKIEFAVQPIDLLLSLIWSIFVRFSKFFFLLKVCEKSICNFEKKVVKVLLAGREIHLKSHFLVTFTQKGRCLLYISFR